MYNRTLWEAMPNESFIYCLEGRTKLIILGVIALAAVIVDSPRTLLLLLWAELFLHAFSRSSFARWQVIMSLLLLTMWGTMASQALFYNQEPRTEIACLVAPAVPVLGSWTGGVYLYLEGLEHGAVQALRSGIMLLAGLLVCWNTDARQLLRVLIYWNFPYEFVFMLITSLRFLPVILNEADTVLTAQRLRGGINGRMISPIRAIRLTFRTLLPILARSMRRAETLAMSVESRGFGRGTHPAYLEDWPRLEKCCCLAGFVGLFGIVTLKALYSLQYNGACYFPSLSGWYDFAQWWL